MAFYYIVFIMLCFLGQGEITIAERKIVLLRERSAVWAMVFLCMASGCRAYSVGADNRSYVNKFLNMNWHEIGLFDSDSMWIYNLWDYLIGLIWKNGYFFNFCCALVISFAVWRCIWKYSLSPVLSVILYFTMGCYFSTMNQTRQSLAIAFLLWGFSFVAERKGIRALICCTIAIFIHNIAIVMVPIYIFLGYFGKTTIKKVYIFSCVAILAVIGVKPLIILFARIFPYYTRYLTIAALFTKEPNLSRYLDFMLVCLIQIVYLWGFYRYGKNLSRDLTELGILLACMNAVNMGMTYLSIHIEIMIRIKILFNYWTSLLFVPYIVYCYVLRYIRNKKIIYLMVSFAGLFYMYKLCGSDGDRVVPYALLWF